MDYVIDSVNSSGVIKIQEDIIHIYRLAFESAPYFKSEAEVTSFRQSLSRHQKRSGFHLLTARDLKTAKIVGFIYG